MPWSAADCWPFLRFPLKNLPILGSNGKYEVSKALAASVGEAPVLPALPVTIAA
jgi:hypothetical protein